MAELHLIISEVDDPEALAEALATDNDAPLAIERILRRLGGEDDIAPDAELMEYEIDGIRRWL